MYIKYLDIHFKKAYIHYHTTDYLLSAIKKNDIDVHMQCKYNIDGKTELLSTRYFAVQFNAVLEMTRTKIWSKIV